MSILHRLLASVLDSQVSRVKVLHHSQRTATPQSRPGLEVLEARIQPATINSIYPTLQPTSPFMPASEADTTPPSASVTALPAFSPASFTLSWSGSDNPAGSGVASYSVYVSIDGAAFQPFLEGVTITSATFSGQGGRSYAFYCVATDNAGNVQPTPASAQATTQVDATPPGASIASLPAFTMGRFPLSWSGSDNPGGSGVASYNIYVSIDGGAFQPFLLGTTLTSTTFPGQGGHSYAFYCRAIDGVGNIQPEPASAQASITVTHSSVVLRRNGNDVELIDTVANQVAFSRPIADPSPFVIPGVDNQPDSVVLDFDHGGEFTLAGGIRFDAGTGPGDSFRILGAGTGAAMLTPGASQTIELLGNTIILTGLERQEVQSLASLTVTTTGGSDHIAVDSAGPGKNLLTGADLVPLAVSLVSDLTIDLGMGDSALAANSLIAYSPWVAQSLQNVTIRGGDGSDALVLRTTTLTLPEPGGNYRFEGNGGTDSVVATGNTDWVLTDTSLRGGPAGTLDLSSIEQATLVGGAGNNLLDASGFSGMTWLTGGPGNDTIRGGNGLDTLVESGNLHFTLTDTRLIGLGRDTLSGINAAELTGGRGNNILNARAFSGPVRLDGAAGKDTLIGGRGDDILIGGPGVNRLFGGPGVDTVVKSGNANFTLTNTRLTGMGVDRLSSIEQAQLTGGPADNQFLVSGWRGQAILDGGDGTDTIVSANDADLTLSDTLLTRSTGGSFALASIESARLIGGRGNNLLDASGFSGTTWLTGGPGDDTLRGGSGFDTLIEGGNVHFTLTDTSLTGLGTDALSGIEAAQLTGGAGNNVLDATGFSGKTLLAGGRGNDTLRAGPGSSILVGGAGNDTLLAGTGRTLLIGGLGRDRLTGGSNDDLLINGTTAFDARIAALWALLAEWERTDVGYNQRIYHLRNGGGLNGDTRLTRQAVRDDLFSETLKGGLGMDWFWLKRRRIAADILADQEMEESVN